MRLFDVLACTLEHHLQRQAIHVFLHSAPSHSHKSAYTTWDPIRSACLPFHIGVPENRLEGCRMRKICLRGSGSKTKGRSSSVPCRMTTTGFSRPNSQRMGNGEAQREGGEENASQSPVTVMPHVSSGHRVAVASGDVGAHVATPAAIPRRKSHKFRSSLPVLT